MFVNITKSSENVISFWSISSYFRIKKAFFATLQSISVTLFDSNGSAIVSKGVNECGSVDLSLHACVYVYSKKREQMRDYKLQSGRSSECSALKSGIVNTPH